jgi:hypothetical protein
MADLGITESEKTSFSDLSIKLVLPYSRVRKDCYQYTNLRKSGDLEIVDLNQLVDVFM